MTARMSPQHFRLFFTALAAALEDDADARRLIRMITRDPVLSARVLRLANVATNAPLREVTTIDQAVVRLGTRAVRRAVLSICFASWGQPGEMHAAIWRRHVEHGIGTGCLARHVAVRAGRDPDEAFVQGLLHDIGKLFLMKLEPEFVRLGGAPPTSAEVAEVIADQHAEVGALAMQLCGLPGLVRDVVRWHHDPISADEHPKAAAVIYIANRLSHRYGFGCDATPEPELAEDAIFLRLTLDAAWLALADRQAEQLYESASQAITA